MLSNEAKDRLLKQCICEIKEEFILQLLLLAKSKHLTSV